MDAKFMQTVARESSSGRCGVLCLLVDSDGSTPRGRGASMWVRGDGSIVGTIGGGPMEGAVIKTAVEMLRAGESEARVVEFDLASGVSGACPEGAVCGGTSLVYLEPIVPSTEIFIFGAGHVGKALSRIACAAGFSVTVWDERPEFADESLLQGANVICCPIDELFDASKHAGLFHSGTYAVVVTRGHSLDAEAMRLLEGRGCAYVGVIGSRSKIAFVDEKLRGLGVSQAYLDGTFRPIGLPIAAETPEEIAVCILAEIIAVHRGADIDRLRGEKKVG